MVTSPGSPTGSADNSAPGPSLTPESFDSEPMPPVWLSRESFVRFSVLDVAVAAQQRTKAAADYKVPPRDCLGSPANEGTDDDQSLGQTDGARGPHLAVLGPLFQVRLVRRGAQDR